MEKLNRNLHLQLQEMCTCYMDTDYLPELDIAAAYQGDELEENAIKYLGLAILEALTQKAKKLTLKKNDRIKVAVSSRDSKIKLPPPTTEITDKIFEIVRAITHIEADKGKSQLAFGLRNSQMELTVKVKKKENKQSLKLIFPELEAG